jgi:hypothetical protein
MPSLNPCKIRYAVGLFERMMKQLESVQNHTMPYKNVNKHIPISIWNHHPKILEMQMHEQVWVLQ